MEICFNSSFIQNRLHTPNRNEDAPDEHHNEDQDEDEDEDDGDDKLNPLQIPKAEVKKQINLGAPI